jgi:hypothetical protein
MLLWAGLFLIVLGVACVAIDRPAVHFLYDHIGARFHSFLSATTHLAKAAHWLAAACFVYAAAWAWLHWSGENAGIRLASQVALAAWRWAAPFCTGSSWCSVAGVRATNWR